MDHAKLLNKVDHTLLAQGATWEEIRQICDDAIRFKTASVCIPPSYVKQAAEYLDGKMPVCTVIGLVATPFCTNTLTLLFFFGLLLPFGTTGLCFGIIMGAITPILGEKRAAVVSGLVQASAGIGDALMSPALNLAISRFDIAVAMQA